jgi:hypothetical protein
MAFFINIVAPNPKGVSQQSPGLASKASLPWVMPPTHHNPKGVAQRMSNVAGGNLIGQPLQGWDVFTTPTQGRCSFLTPTLGFAGKPLWGLETKRIRTLMKNAIILKTAVGGEVLREDVAADALRAFVTAHLLVRRTKALSADAAAGSARRPDSTAVFRITQGQHSDTTTNGTVFYRLSLHTRITQEKNFQH